MFVTENWETRLYRVYTNSCLRFVVVNLFRFKFDDERVTKEDMKKALEEQYGGEEEVCIAKQNALWRSPPQKKS